MENSALGAAVSKGTDPGVGGREKGSLQTARWQIEDTGLVVNVQAFIHSGSIHCLRVPGPVLCPGQGRDRPEVKQTVLGWLKVS